MRGEVKVIEQATVITLSRLEFHLYHIIPMMLIAICILILFFYGHRANMVLKGMIEKYGNDLHEFKKSIVQSDSKTASKIISALQNSPASQGSITDRYNRLYAVFNKIKKATGDNLYNAMISIRASRVAIYLFHNGTKTSSGFDFLKVSCVGEKIMIGSGIKEKILSHSNIPVNILDNMYDVLFSSGRYIIHNDEPTMNTAKSQFISSNKIEYSQAICLYDANNNVIGFVLAEFDHSYLKKTGDEEYEKLKKLSTEFAPIFYYSDYTNLTIKDEEE